MAEQQTLNLSTAKSHRYSDLAPRYIEHQVADGRCRKSFYHLTTTWLPVLGDVDVRQITSDDLTYLVNQLTSSKSWAPHTRTLAINVLSGFFAWCVQRRKVTENPCKLVPRKQGKALKNARRFVITRDQLRKLLDILRMEEPVYAAVIIAAKTGLRFGKIASLRPDDLRMDTDGSWFLQVDDKNGEEHRAYIYGEALSVAQTAFKRGLSYLFAGPNGGQLRQKYVRDHLMPACKMVGIPYGRTRDGFTFHSLRRAFASHLLNSGASIEEVMRAGNWKSYAAVERYARLSDDRKKASFRKIDRLL